MSLDPHYKVLGLPPGSALALVKKAYLREIKTWHPDRYAPDSILREQAEERTKALTAAYAALSTALKAAEPGGEMRERPGTAAAAGKAPVPGGTETDRKAQAGSPDPATPGPEEEAWLGRVWRRLKDQWQGPPATAGPTKDVRPKAAGPSRGKKGARGGRGRRGRVRSFEEVLESARTDPHPEAPAEAAVTWRRLATRRSRYQRRRGGTGAVGGVKRRGPVTRVDPVRPIRPIGRDD